MKKINFLWTVAFLALFSIWNAAQVPMSFGWDIKLNWSNAWAWLLVDAYCWQNGEKIWSVITDTTSVYWNRSTNKLIINWWDCSENIFVQVSEWNIFTPRINSRIKFKSWDFYTFDIITDNMNAYYGSYVHNTVYQYWEWEFITNTDLIILPEMTGDISTKKDINLKKVDKWTLPLDIVLMEESWENYIKIFKDTKIFDEDWGFYRRQIKAPFLVSINSFPKYNWKKVVLKAIDFSSDLEDTTFSKDLKLHFSTEWLPSWVDEKNIYIYSYNDKKDKYTLEDESRFISSTNNYTSIKISHFWKFVMTNWKIDWEIIEENDIVEEEFSSPFNDISSHWAKKYIEKLYSKWALANRSKYNPNRNLNRVELIKMSLETFWYWKHSDLSIAGYKDFDSNAWYAWYVANAISEWIINWPSLNPNLRPSEYITKAEALKIILKSSWLNIVKKQSQFTDVRNQWFARYINFAADKWIVSWYSNWTFRPMGRVTRWEVAKMIIKTMEITNN